MIFIFFYIGHISLGDDISMIRNLEKLEVLIFAYSNIKELPTVIGNLKELRLLELTRCEELPIIALGVLSSLISLEELYMRGTPLCHGDKVQAGCYRYWVTIRGSTDGLSL